MSSQSLVQWKILLFLLGSQLGECQTCGSNRYLFPGESEVVRSPNYPNFYPRDTRCEWIYATESDSIIEFTCTYFNLPPYCFCDYFLTTHVNDNTYTSFSSRYTLCGSQSVSITYSEGVRIYFQSCYFPFFPNLLFRGFDCLAKAVSSVTTSPGTTTTPTSCNCGTMANQNRIVNGSESDIHEWAWQVILFRTSTAEHFCSGVLLSNSYVLTACHCLEGFNYDSSQAYVVLGEHNLVITTESAYTTFRNIETVIPNPNYNTNTLDNDIGLIKLSVPVSYSAGIQPVCLPFNYEAYSFQNEKAWVTGWGVTSFGGTSTTVPHEVELPILTTEECRQYTSTADITDNMFCAYEEGKDACQGDSGGPMSWKSVDGRWYVIGLVSFGEKCAEKDKPGVYTKITKYMNWIEQNTGYEFCRL